MQDKSSPLTPCPGRQELGDFAKGRLADEAIEIITAHVVSCTECEAKLDGLLEEDTFAELHRQSVPDRDLFRSPAFWRMTEAVQALPHETETKRQAETEVIRELGEYLLLEKLGQGGMGVVYRARHTKLNSIVAVKLLHPRWTGDAERLERFYREMEALGSLGPHANIVLATDAREVNGTHLLAMEYVEGIDFSRLVRRAGALRVAAACETIRQAALGLERLRERGVVHRDVKSSNLLLSCESGRAVVKILDLGLALFLPESGLDADSLTNSDVNTLGTTDYMAPEQASGASEVDIRADIYSLGCVFYKLLAAETPFQDLVGQSKVEAHRLEPVPDIRRKRPEVSDDVAKILERMLAKKRADRQSPLEVASQLESHCSNQQLAEVLNTTGVEAGRVALPVTNTRIGTKIGERIKTARRWPIWAIAASAAVVILATGLLAIVGKPRGFQDFSAEEIEYDRHYPLLDQSPFPLYLPSDSGESSYAYNRRAQRLVVTSRERTWLSLGTARRKSFDLAIDIYQNQWPGNVGIFFGYHQIEAGDEPRFQYQAIEIHRKRGKRVLRIDRSVGWVRHLPNGSRLFEDQFSCGSQLVDVPTARHHTLRIIVREWGIEQVSWGGQRLGDLCSLAANHPELPGGRALQEDAYLGRFGVSVHRGDATFTNSGIQFLRPLTFNQQNDP